MTGKERFLTAAKKVKNVKIFISKDPSTDDDDDEKALADGRHFETVRSDAEAFCRMTLLCSALSRMTLRIMVFLRQ